MLTHTSTWEQQLQHDLSDEIGELTPEHQVKILRVLKRRKSAGLVKQLNGSSARVIAATNDDLFGAGARRTIARIYTTGCARSRFPLPRCAAILKTFAITARRSGRITHQESATLSDEILKVRAIAGGMSASCARSYERAHSLGSDGTRRTPEPSSTRARQDAQRPPRRNRTTCCTGWSACAICVASMK